ncbi:MAG: glycosyltransferase [Patescibacteria group bacterium]|nr:glycosyltransferase [Patescibacteria group bacterium]
MKLVSKFLRHVFKARSWRRLFSHLAAIPSRYLIARKLSEQKRKRAVRQYNQNPRVSGIMQFFNKKQNISMLWRGLVAANFDEVILLDDGSVDGSSSVWIPRLELPNHFLIRSNDLFEIVTYDRALHFSRAEIVCLLQDDDQMPADRAWIDRALSLFEEFPDLLILGGFRAVDVLPREEGTVADEMVLEVNGDQESVAGLFRHRTIEFPIDRSPSGVSDFCFVMSVVRAPVFIRRREFLDLGGFDLNFSPFLCDDIDNSLRAWRAGYKVGLFSVDFQRDLGLGGMRAFNGERMVTQVRANWEKVYQKHGEVIKSGEIAAMVDSANQVLMQRVDL